MFKPAHLLVLVTFASIGASAAAPTYTDAQFIRTSGPQCFRASSVSRFAPGPMGYVMVRADGNRWFQMHLSPGCPDFRLIMEIGIRPNDSSWLCEGKGDELGGLPPDRAGRCFVNEIRQLPPGAMSGAI